MIRVSYNDVGVGEKIKTIKLAMEGETFDIPIDAASWKAHAKLTVLTPRGWTGLTMKNWKVGMIRAGVRTVYNDSKIFLWLNNGTGNAGTPTSNGGYIYPKTKLFLFIPLTQQATYGWTKGMVFGSDYVLAKRVRGIRPMQIMEKFAPEAQQILRDEMKKFLQKILT